MNRFILNLRRLTSSLGSGSMIYSNAPSHTNQGHGSQGSVLTSIIGNIGEVLDYDTHAGSAEAWCDPTECLELGVLPAEREDCNAAHDCS